MADETIGSGEDVVKADAKTNLLNHLVGIFLIDAFFDTVCAWFFKVFRGNLDQVCDSGLMKISMRSSVRGILAKPRTRMNISGAFSS